LRQGPFVVCLNLAALVLTIALDWWAALRFGLAGAAMGSVAVMYLDRVATLWRISRLVGLPVRGLQDWRSLALRLLLAVVAAPLAWSVVARYFAARRPAVHLIVGGAVLMAAYATMAELCGAGRDTLAPARDPGHGL